METERQPTAGERDQFSEPLERRGEWNGQSLMASARQAWNQKQPGALISGNEERFARGLGWFSIGLGLTEILAPRTLERFLGIKQHRLLIRVMGLREIASGIGILAGRRPAGWLWARVAGDLVDVAALGMALKSDTANPANIGFACAMVGGVTALDVGCAQELSRDGRAGFEPRPIEVSRSIQINRSPAEIYRFWRDFENLPEFMSNVESVQTATNDRSHWVVRGPAGKRIEWDAEIVAERENSLIAWRSLEGAQVKNCGTVRFETAPAGRGSFVRVRLEYSPPGGILGATVAKLFGRAPEQQLHEDLHHLKQIMETGEIITTQGQPAGRPSSTSWKYDRTIRRQKDASTAFQSSTV